MDLHVQEVSEGSIQVDMQIEAVQPRDATRGLPENLARRYPRF